MSRVVYQPPTGHSCAPGWEWRAVDREMDPAFPDGYVLGLPPTPSKFPAGTVWECRCGRTWVSTGPSGNPHNARSRADWRREGWFARWRRLRRSE